MTIQSSEHLIRRIYQITQNYAQGFEQQMQDLLTLGLERFNLDIGILSHITGNSYSVEYCVTPEGVPLAVGDKFELDHTYCEITCMQQLPVALEHVAQTKYAKHPAYADFALEAYIGIPIKPLGKLYGTLNFSSAEPHQRQFSAIDIDALQLMAAWIETELVRQQQQKKLLKLNQILEQKAYQDYLTHVPNRQALFSHLPIELNRCIRDKSQAVIAIIDIDLFKQVNDKYGHQMGDEVLIAVASVLKKTIRDYDYVARFGGEEFLLWLPNTDKVQAQSLFNRIQQQLKAIDIIPTAITISMGCYQIHGDKEPIPQDIKQLVDRFIRNADQALYQAKELGRDRIVVS